MRMLADSKKKDKLLDWRVQGCLCFVLCKQLQANLVNALSQEKAMCAQGRVRVPPPAPQDQWTISLTQSCTGGTCSLQKQSFCHSAQVENELLFVVHNLQLCTQQDCAGTGELLIDPAPSAPHCWLL